MKVFQIINIVIGCLFALFYAYQTVYAVIAMFIKRKKLPDAEQNNRYAILICARNEENVIGAPFKAADFEVALANGWSWIGYPEQRIMSLEDAFADAN